MTKAPRPQTQKKPRKVRTRRKNIANAARAAFKQGLSNEETLVAIKAYFPEAKTTIGSVRAMRAHFRTKGEKIPAARESEKLRKARDAKAREAAAAAESAVKTQRGRKPKAAPAPAAKTVTKTTAKPAAKTASGKARVKKTAPNVQAPATKTVAIASDHAGVALKEALKAALKEWGLIPLDLGTNSSASVDYPDYAQAVAQALAWGEATRGVVICGSGVGISIAINRHKHIRAALVGEGLAARLARQHNDANVLALGARLTGIDVAKDCLYQFLHTQYEGGRHQHRIDKMS